MEQVVQVHCSEGIAIHIGPKPCIDAREGVGEASVGEHTGQPLSHESFSVPGADAVRKAEGNTYECVIASARATWRGRRTWHVCTLHDREPGDLGFGQSQYLAGPHREGEEP